MIFHVKLSTILGLIINLNLIIYKIVEQILYYFFKLFLLVLNAFSKWFNTSN